MIELVDVSKQFGTVDAVSHVSFRIEEEEILGFLGPNGAGKTTTMRMISGYILPSSGEITIDGESIFQNPVMIKEKIGYLSENVPLYNFYTVEEFLCFIACIKNVRQRDVTCRVKYVMERCGLIDVKNRLIGHLSKGYKQRVGIAQAIVHNPKVLILDEPTTGLDPKQIIDVRNLILSLKRDHTIIISSHILPEVSMICEKIIIINKGRIAVEDSTDKILDRLHGPKHVYLEMAAEITDDMLEELCKIDGVSSAERKNSGCVVYVKDDRQGRQNLAKHVVGKGWGLLEMSVQRASLEEVFLEVIADEDLVNS